MYEANNAQVLWDVPLFEQHQKVKASRVDAHIINHKSKQVITLGLQTVRKGKEEKATKYGPLRWELNKSRSTIEGYEVKQYNIIMDVLGGWCRDLEFKLKELVGSKSKGVLHHMQKAVLSALNISRTFKVAT